ncbi:cyclic-di-AMP-binding protein CbpB [Streptococcus himalayensis]|uniref:CBS domain-containing protein n=1 Tax=Streptococcus himalayensis TaxID=1888195 RepID=A0A917ABT9_9STRE|nr:cyclic-di-AMP-binding protein CbpB [Streptococcus himalayensis]GGE37387.1 CBS domain-containing protein [Streptococcus himalayensis]
MIDKAFERYLLEQKETFLTPADNLAVLIDTHNVDHAILLLSQITYSRVPVITADKEFVGTISLTDILAYQMQQYIPDEVFLRTDIVAIVEKNRATVGLDFTVTEVLHKLVDESFLPVVDEKHRFQGIITRKSILKAINALLHNFTSEYDIVAK